ncbi:hypothetical protein Pla175_38730 [Pirellulimonas nuda]|uniref:EF-hand domain-containing protein n=1 Tax=Pirellulimonas nuda TaxID=2528009 RepID=A0A518DG67_9BACT|nr:hypothetical protein [Pirellulimonas nuda]QDU90468.1 hypothetical protein Pla175_38730 [Pirellulimonas nuda]
MVVLCGPTDGHQLDELVQATLVDVTPSAVHLSINLSPGVEIAEKVIALADRDADGVISTAESEAYARGLTSDLAVSLDGHELTLKVHSARFPDVAELQSGWGVIQIELAAPFWWLASGRHTLSFQNKHQRDLSVFLFNAAMPGSQLIEIEGQHRNADQSEGSIDFAYHRPRGDASGWLIMLGAGVVVVVAGLVWRVGWRR